MSEAGNNQNAGGLGDALSTNPRTAASEQRLMRRAIRNRWPIKPHVLERVAEESEKLLNATDGRVKASALKTLVEMNKQNITIDQEEDKVERLDAGKATEVVGHQVIKVEFDNAG